MKQKLHLSSIAVLIGGIALTGCAAKKSWSPELIEARQTYEQISADPVVAELASAELATAHKQLLVAQDAADYFKGREVISHEAELAKLQTLVALQTARSLAAKNNLRVAQSEGQLMQQPTRFQVSQNEPAMAAALPGYETTVTSSTDTLVSMVETAGNETTGWHDGYVQGGHSEMEMASGDAQLVQQLASLSAQINQLQTRIEHGAYSTAQAYSEPEQVISLADTSIAYASSSDITLEEPQMAETAEYSSIADYHLSDRKPAGGNVYQNATEQSLQIQPDQMQASLEPVSDEPQMGAAMAAPENNAAPANELAANPGLRSELRAMNARPSSRGMTLTLGDRYFESQSARLWNGRAGRHLDNIAAVMAENPGLAIEVEAHSDNSGTDDGRRDLTQDRAIAVKSELVLRGISAARINTAGLSDSVPLANNDSELGRLQNRRVEIIFPNVSM